MNTCSIHFLVCVWGGGGGGGGGGEGVRLRSRYAGVSYLICTSANLLCFEGYQWRTMICSFPFCFTLLDFIDTQAAKYGNANDCTAFGKVQNGLQ